LLACATVHSCIQRIQVSELCSDFTKIKDVKSLKLDWPWGQNFGLCLVTIGLSASGH